MKFKQAGVLTSHHALVRLCCRKLKDTYHVHFPSAVEILWSLFGFVDDHIQSASHGQQFVPAVTSHKL